MSDFLIKNWLALASLTVAVLGGVPGITSIFDFIGRRPKFGIDLGGYMTGTVGVDSGEMTVLLLTLIVWNKGGKPLVPAFFDLEVKVGGRWITLIRHVIPDQAVYNSASQVIRFGPNQTDFDLHKFTGSIAADTPVDGQLLFLTKDIPLETFRSPSGPPPAKLVCRDVFGKKHKVTLDLGREEVEGSIVFPRQGIVVSPRSTDRAPG